MKSPFFAMCLCTAVCLLTAVQGQAAGYSSPAKISHIGTPEGDGKFFIRGTWNDIDTCGSVDKFLVGYHAVDTVTSREMKLSLVLTAFSTGQTVELYLDGCQNNYPVVKGIYLPSRS